jgi:hypothetical protein
VGGKEEQLLGFAGWCTGLVFGDLAHASNQSTEALAECGVPAVEAHSRSVCLLAPVQCALHAQVVSCIGICVHLCASCLCRGCSRLAACYMLLYSEVALYWHMASSSRLWESSHHGRCSGRAPLCCGQHNADRDCVLQAVMLLAVSHMEVVDSRGSLQAGCCSTAMARVQFK